MSLDFDAIRERAAAATPGPWTADHEWCQINTPDGRRLFEVLLGDNDTRENAQQAIADAEFVAHANQDVPALLAEIVSLTAELEQMKQVVAAARSVFEVEHRRAEKAEAEQDRLRDELAARTTDRNYWAGEVGRWKAEHDNIEYERDQLRDRVAELEPEVPHLVHMGTLDDGRGYEVVVKRGPRLIEAMAGALYEWLDGRGAENYTETEMTDGQGGKFLLIVVRPGKKTPHQLRRDAEAERDAALTALTEARAMGIGWWHELCDARASLTAERERTARMRAVVETLRPLVAASKQSTAPRTPAYEAVIAALNALDAGAATGGEDGTDG